MIAKTDDDLTRREVLRTAATAGIATAGVAAATAGTSAQWWGSSGVETFDLGTGGASVLPDSDASDLTVYLHGASVGDTADEQGQELEDGLADAGYDTTVVAGVYSESDVSIGSATSDPAEHLADLIQDYVDTTGGTIHVVGYSLGGIVTMQTLTALDAGYVLDSASTLGTGTPDSTVCEGEVYHDGIANNTETFCVLYSEDDSAISSMNAMEPDCDGISVGPAPDNVERVDVTSDVDSHLVYLDSSLVMDELADCFDGTDSGDDGTDGGDDGSFGWW